MNIIWKNGICLVDIDECKASKPLQIVIKLGEKNEYINLRFYTRYLILPDFSHYLIDTNTDVSFYINIYNSKSLFTYILYIYILIILPRPSLLRII